MPRITAALDPAARSPGWALFIDGWLLGSGHVRPGTDTRDNPMLRVPQVGAAVVAAMSSTLAPWPHLHLQLQGCDYVCEWPRIYPGGRTANPNDLAWLWALCGEVSGRLAPANAMSYEPAEWTQGTKKTTRGSALASPRGVKILEVLQPFELPAVEDQHDALDAVGIGLYHLRRFRLRRVYSTGQ